MYNRFIDPLVFYRFREKLAELTAGESGVFRSEFADTDTLPYKLLKYEELQYSVLKDGMIYYNGQFFPAEAFEYSDGKVSLTAEVEADPEHYCLQKHIVFYNEVPAELMAEYEELTSASLKSAATGSIFSAYLQERDFSRCVYVTRNDVTSQDGLNSFKRALRDMPDDFGGALQFILDEMGLTQEDFESLSGISARTLRRMKEDSEYQPRLRTVIAVCVALHLFPLFSNELIKRAGYCIDRLSSNTDAAYKLIINVLYDSGLDECNSFLAEFGLETLTDKEFTPIELL